jgi:formamidopyrimidine-DNA glycosylase
MDQSLFSGIGNIYSDEILFQARIHPKRKVNDLSKKEKTALYRKTGRVLETAIERMSGPGTFPAHFLLPRRNEGEKCPYCEGTVEKIKISGRGCFICPSCQKETP